MLQQWLLLNAVATVSRLDRRRVQEQERGWRPPASEKDFVFPAGLVRSAADFVSDPAVHPDGLCVDAAVHEQQVGELAH